MSTADELFFGIFSLIVTVVLVGIRDRLKRIEDKIDKLGK